jgi:hypothetical protein
MLMARLTFKIRATPRGRYLESCRKIESSLSAIAIRTRRVATRSVPAQGHGIRYRLPRHNVTTYRPVSGLASGMVTPCVIIPSSQPSHA